MELLDPTDLINCMHASIEINDFIMNDAKLIQLFMRKVQEETGEGGVTPLHYAAMKSGVEQVKVLCQYTDLLPMKTEYGKTPLHKAVIRGNLEIVKELCQNMSKEQCLIEDEFECTPLYYAVYSEHVDIVDFFCNFWSEEEIIKQIRGETFLHLAARCENSVVFKILWRNLPSQHYEVNVHGQTALHFATGNFDTMAFLCRKLSVEKLQEKDRDNFTALAIAAKQGHAKSVEVFCKVLPRKELTIPVGVVGAVPLHCAASRGHVEVVKVLCQYMSSEHWAIQSRSFETPLHLAAIGGHAEVVEFLCKILTQEQVGRINAVGRTALHEASVHGRSNVVKILCKFMPKAKIGATDSLENKTALYYASGYGFVEIVEVLCQNMSQDQIDHKCSGKGTALHKAASRGHVEVVKVLCKYMSHEVFGMQNQLGKIPMHLCPVEDGVSETVKVLCQHMSKDQFFIQDGFDKTPLDWALDLGFMEIADLLSQHMFDG